MEEFIYNNFHYKHDIDSGLLGVEHSIKQPKSLFKFFPLSQYSVKNLTQNQFYAPHFYELNDILDGSAFLWYTSERFSRERYEERFMNFPKEIFEKIYIDDGIPEKLGKQFLAYNWSVQTNRLGVMSFTAQENNILMWPHYAQEEGFQIKINTEKLHSHFLNNFDGVYLGIYPMNYSDELQCFDLSKTESDIIPILYAATIKSKVWQYEKEWRVFVSRQDMGIPYSKSPMNPMNDIILQPQNRIIKHPANLIEEITVGSNFINQKKFNFKREMINGLVSSKTYFEILQETEKYEYLEELLNYICANFQNNFYFPTTSIKIDINQNKILTRGKERINIVKINDANFMIERTGEFIYFDKNGDRIE